MPYLKAGYFIDEVYHHLAKTVGEPVLADFYEKNLPFKADGFAKTIRITGENPLIKVAWNIITRGRPTRASLGLSKFILQKNLNTGSEAASEDEEDSEDPAIIHENGQTKIDLPWEGWSALEKEPLTRMLDLFHKVSPKQAAQEFSEPYLTVYNILKDLQACAQIQQLLLLMYLSYFPSEEFYVNIKGMDDALATALVQDLNELFEHLNGLITKKEKPLASIVNEDVIKAHTVIYESKPQLGFRVSSIAGKIDPDKENKISFFSKVLTDRKIEYASLGTLLEMEVPKAPITPEETDVEDVDDAEEGEEHIESEVPEAAAEEKPEESGVEEEEGGEDENSGDEKEEAQPQEPEEESQALAPEAVEHLPKFSYKDVKQEAGLLYILRNVFRMSDFRPMQEVIINRILQDKHTIGVLPAGAGKSLPFQVCGLLQPGVTVILEPNQAYIRNEWESLHTHAIHNTLCIHTFNSPADRNKKLSSLLKSENQFVYLSPDWLYKKDFRKILKSCTKYEVFFSHMVLDEAHRASEWGPDFNPTYVGAALQAKVLCQPKDKELVYYSMTAPTTLDVLKDIKREFEWPADALITFPEEALYPKDLHIRILKVDHELNDKIMENRKARIREIGSAKHRDLLQFLQTVPDEFNEFESTEEGGAGAFLEKNAHGTYSNAGLIFSPAASRDQKNGALAIKDTLESGSSPLEIGVITGEDPNFSTFAPREGLIGNNKNMMIATHDAGVALNRSNIRFTCHYTFPATVEGFYQEAGRAGRDGRSALSAILYHPDDLRTKYEHYDHTLEAFSKDKKIIKELLTEVKLDKDFNLEIIKRKAKLKFPEIGEVNVVDRKYLTLQGSEEKVQIASVVLQGELKLDADYIQNFDKAKSAKIGRYIIKLLKNESRGKDPVAWLHTRSVKGIIPQLKEDPKGTHRLRIGLDNGLINKITVALKQKNQGMEPSMVRSAYRLSDSPEEFIEAIKAQYHFHSVSDGELSMTKDEESKIISSYALIRDPDDILRALFRLRTIGIIDGFVIDDLGGFVEMEFSAKKEGIYLKNFKNYLTRYFGNGTAGNWIKKARSNDAGTTPEKVVYTFIEFVQKEIFGRKKRSIDHMKQLCDAGFEQGENIFKERVASYYTAKYSSDHYLVKDTDGGKVESAEIVKKYLRFINNPPDGQGGELTNTMHLRNACEKFRSEVTEENASVNILMAYSYFASEVQEGEDVDSILNRPLVQKAIELYSHGFKTLEEKEPWIEMVQLLGLFSTKVLDLNPGLKPYLVPLVEKILIHRTSSRLKRFINKITSHE